MIDGDRPPEALGGYTGFLMNWVAARSRARFADALGELGLKPQQFAALSVIDANPGRPQSELVGDTGIDPSTMVALVDSLEAAGLAERHVHETDRRKRVIHLTARGRATLAHAQRAAARVGEELMAPLDAAERAELQRLMRRLAGLE